MEKSQSRILLCVVWFDSLLDYIWYICAVLNPTAEKYGRTVPY